MQSREIRNLKNMVGEQLERYAILNSAIWHEPPAFPPDPPILYPLHRPTAFDQKISEN